MTLREKFNIISCKDCDMPYCDIKCTNLSEQELNKLEKIAEEFAIEFADWLKKEDTPENAEKYFGYTDKNMLEEFKKQKGL